MPRYSVLIICSLTIDGRGVHVCLEMSGASTALQQCLSAVMATGQVTVLALYASPPPIDVSASIVLRDVTLRGVYGRRIWDTWMLTARLIANGLNCSPVVTHRFAGLAEWQLGVEAMLSGTCGKCVFFPHGFQPVNCSPAVNCSPCSLSAARPAVIALTYEDKQVLKQDIFKLPSHELQPVVDIISKHAKTEQNKNDSDEIEIDLDLLDIETLRELQAYVKKAQAAIKRKNPVTPRTSPSTAQTATGTKPTADVAQPTDSSSFSGAAGIADAATLPAAASS